MTNCCVMFWDDEECIYSRYDIALPPLRSTVYYDGKVYRVVRIDVALHETMRYEVHLKRKEPKP